MKNQRVERPRISGRIPTTSEPILTEENLIPTLNWYYQTLQFDKEKARENLIEFASKEMGGRCVSELRRINRHDFNTAMGVFARQHLIGNNVENIKKLKAYITYIAIQFRTLKDKPKNETPGEDNSSRRRSTARKYIADIEDILDTFYSNKYKEAEEIDFYKLFIGWDIKTIHAKSIVEYYTPLASEIYMSLMNKDAQLKEAYPTRIGVAGTKRYAAFVSKIVTAATSIMKSNQVSRNTTPVSKKVVAKKKETAYDDVKFLKHSTEYQVRSIEPSAITGSSMFLTFNEVYRTLTVYYAKEGMTLDVKSTSVINFDEGKSFCIIIRKPNEVLPKLFNGGKKYIENTITGLKVKHQPARSVLNLNTVLLRSIKG